MTIHKCKDCVEFDKKEKFCGYWVEPRKNCNTCKEWVDDKERIERTSEINRSIGLEDISLKDYNKKYNS